MGEAFPAVAALAEEAPAKVNLTLRVLGRRPDGYHEIESLVVFAGEGDRLTLVPGARLALQVEGPTAAAAGDTADNLVLRAARALAARVDGLVAGRFALVKSLPVAAGLGGGSSDAAAALRLLARANRLPFGDARLIAAAEATGADVPVCLDPCPRLMRGIGEILSAPLDLPPLPAVLVNPGIQVPTRDVFAALDMSGRRPHADVDLAGLRTPAALFEFLGRYGNDLEAAAVKIAPAIAQVLDDLRVLPGARLARMSGSGATCFALFETIGAAEAAAGRIGAAQPGWWCRATLLGGV
ncbi:MAG TPA: 4-(cytidine 5'-diphospho)-2-C-methyl-D-erythritol kinase [Xanthobacteraceae bacterium]|nr:4-(cytidine 5'-diphospho)-2-C-methyl-D-erythritol kinase [Xanthobacteraceae bacterium]